MAVFAMPSFIAMASAVITDGDCDPHRGGYVKRYLEHDSN